ncbi:MAG: hypothetical protein IT317_22840 [Anaerolineales bacterium]|nr:hypothetical protein [Anaerolineales bacterium]
MKTVLLALVALAAGAGLGLLYSWVISPVEYTDTGPNTLRADYQAAYVQWAARALAVDGNLGRARTRLALLGWSDPAQAAAALASRLQSQGADAEQVAAVAGLAAALGGQAAPTQAPAGGTPAAEVSATPAPPTASATPPPPTPTVVPSITPQLLPTRTPTATPQGAFDFKGRQLVCDPTLGEPLIQVMTEDAGTVPVPGVEVVVTWEGGFDHFYTGLKPDQGQGYGDFTMAPGIEYTVHLAESPSLTVEGITVENCGDGAGGTFPGAWLLVFRQP